MPRGGQIKIVLDRDDDLADRRPGHAIFLGDLGLAFRFAIDHGQVAFRLHRGLTGSRVGQGLQQPDRRLIPKGAACSVAVLLSVPLAPKFAEHFQRPPVEHSDLRGERGRRRHTEPRVEEHVLGGVVREFWAAARLVKIGGVSEL